MDFDALMEPLTATGISPAVFLLVALIIVIFLLLVIITRGRVLRVFRMLFRSSKFIRLSHRTGERARSVVGTSGLAAFRRLIFHPLTATERELIKADSMTQATNHALDAAIKEYRDQGERNPDIDRVIPKFAELEETYWVQYKDKELAELREQFVKNQQDDIYFDEIYALSLTAFQTQDARMHREGMIFRDLSVDPRYIRLEEGFSIEDAEKNYILASKFFLHDIPVQSDENLLYEDVTDALIVRMTGSADKDIFFFLTEMRKTVNRNVRLLSTLIALFVAAFIFANYWFPDVMHLIPSMQAITGSDSAATGINGNFVEVFTQTMSSQSFIQELIYRSVFALGLFLVVIALVGFYYRNPYTHYQSQNRVHLTNFMTGYSALLVSNYTHAESQSRGSFSGDQTGTAARENSKIWFMTMQWIAFRLFCVELFLHSVIFQIRRNSGYYILGMPLLITLPTIIFLCWIPDLILNPASHAAVSAQAVPVSLLKQFEGATIDFIQWLALNAAFMVLLLILSWNVCWKGCLTQCVQGFVDIKDASWKNFHNLDLQGKSGSLVRHFVAEIYNERNRWRSGGGGSNG